MRPDQAKEERKAFHEAGHAIVAITLGNVIDWIGIVPPEHAKKLPENEWFHSIESGVNAGGCTLVYDGKPTRRDELVFMFGGLACEGIRWGTASRESNRGDLEAINLRLGRSRISVVEKLRHRDLAFNHATAILTEHWLLVERLALALLEHKELTGMEAMAAIYPEAR